MTLATISNLKCPKCGTGYHSESDFLRRSTKWHMPRANELYFSCPCGQQLTLRKSNLLPPSPSSNGKEQTDQGIFHAILHKRLPGLSDSARRISAALQNHGTSNEQVASLFKVEPLLAARVLFMANAAQQSFSSRRPVDGGGLATPPPATSSPSQQAIKSISHAIGVLGRTPLVNLLTISELASLSFGKCKYGQKDFLRDVLAISSAADFLATKFPSANCSPERAYYCAALSIIGRAVQAICYPSLTNQLLKMMELSPTPLSWEEAEISISGLPTSVELGAVAASVWDLSFDPAVFSEKKVKRLAAEPSTLLSLAEVLSAAVALSALATRGPLGTSDYLTSQVQARFEIGDYEWKAMATSIRGIVKMREASLAEFVQSPEPNGSAA